VREGNAQLIDVNVLNDDGKTSAIAGKIRPGEQVVTDGQLRVTQAVP